MDGDVQPSDPTDALLETARSVVPAWLRRITTAAAGQHPPDGLVDEISSMAADASAVLLDQLASLLATDVDEQRTNPLSLFRSAVAAPTALLLRYEIAPPPTDPFVADRFPDDPYRLGPATWSDVDPALHEAGLTWGAWKAMTVLRRRRDDGLR